MKKNKEWLQKELIQTMGDASVFYDLVTAERKNAYKDILKLVDQLDEPEILSQEWIDKHAEYYEYIGYAGVPVDDLKNLLVPKQEKPSIPQFVADWYEQRKRNLDDELNILAYEMGNYDGVRELNSFGDWFINNENTLLILSDMRYGYEVEKEKLYQVELPTEGIYHILTMHGDGEGYFFGKEHTNNFWYRTYLTEQEIKAIDERFWAFAEEVE